MYREKESSIYKIKGAEICKDHFLRKYSRFKTGHGKNDTERGNILSW